MRVSLRAAALTAAFFVSIPGFAAAEDVTLRARSGPMELTGALIAYDGETYRLETRWGRLTIEAAAVDCTGPGCPELQSFAPELRIMADAGLAAQVLPPILRAWAEQEGLKLQTEGDRHSLVASDGARLHIRRLDPATNVTAALTAGDADGALVLPPLDAARAPGRPVAQVPLVLASSITAPPGPLARADLRRARAQEPRWTALTGTDQPLVWHSPGSFADLAAIARFGPSRFAPQTAADLPALVVALARDPWGLALLPAPLPEGLVERQVTDSCGLIRDASPFALAAGEHPLAISIHWQSAGRKLPAEARRFADYLTSQPPGALAPDQARALTDQGPRLANALLSVNPDVTLADLQTAIAQLAPAKRLPLTIRFDRSGAPDGAGRAAVDTLIALSDSGGLAGYDLLLAGFTDAQGGGASNRKASLARATALQELLQKSLPPGRPSPVIHSAGFGEALPLACNDSAEGRHLNRRVEVWLLPKP